MKAQKCPVCEGSGKYEDVKCHGCEGKGWILIPEEKQEKEYVPYIPYVPYVPYVPPEPYDPWPWTNPWTVPTITYKYVTTGTTANSRDVLISK